MGGGRNILIYRLGSLGDTIIALPAFHVVREAFPQARIVLLTNLPVAAKAAPAATVLGEGYFFDQLVAYPVGLRNPGHLLGLIAEIRKLGVDTVVNLNSFRSVADTWRDKAFFRLAGARRLIGFAGVLAKHELREGPQTGMVEWEAERLARQVASLREIDLQEDHWWDLRLTTGELAGAKELLKPLSGVPSLMAISLGTKLQANDWGLSNWQELVGRLGQNLPGWGLVFIGAPDEKENCESCRQRWPGPSVNLCGLCPPRMSAAVLKQCRVFAGHDSGPMHLAACVGTPCVGVFSARNLPGHWYPRGRRNKIIYHRTECAGCRLEVCVTEKKKCITSITVSEVEQAVQQIAGSPR